MSIPVRCPGCGSAMKVADQFAGKKGKCPKCGRLVQVPKIARAMNPQQPAAAPLQSAKAPTPTNIRAPLSPVRPETHGNKRSAPPPWVWVAGSGGVAVVILLLVGFVARDSNDSTAAAPKTIASATRPATGDVAPKESKTWATQPASNTLSPPSPPFVPANASVDVPSGRAQAKIAKTLDEVTNAIVKFEMPLPDGRMSTGAGFLIDRRGWVATNNHVASMASTAARVKMYTGRRIEIEGIIAVAPEWDLAIVKLKELPSNLTLLDIGYRERPKIGTTVYAYGHPENLDFSASRGIVSRVLTTGELMAQQPGNIIGTIKVPADHLWIQTDAKILQGNSGGPLLDDDCRVIGVNTFLNVKAMYGYASHVKYLKELADTSSGKATPLKQPSEIKPPEHLGSSPGPGKPHKVAISKEKLQHAFDAAAAFDWKPANQEEYKKLAELALIMTACKEPKAPFELSDLADRLFEKMKLVPWSDEHVNAINRHAVGQITTPDHGAIFVGTVTGTATGKSGKTIGCIVHVSGVSDLFLVPIDTHSLTPSQGTRLLVFGVVLPQISKAKIPGQTSPRTIRFIRSHHTLSVM